MSLFTKLTGIDNKSAKNQPKNLILESEEEIDFFNEESPLQKTKKTKIDASVPIVADEEQTKKAKRKTTNKSIKKNNTERKTITTDWDKKDYEEGELSIDVYQDKNDIIVKSTIAGARPEDIDISVNNDMLTIRGKREHEEIIDEKNYYYKECYWGSFSRSIILPYEIKTDKITAKLKNGVLIVRLPKTKETKKIAIKVVEE